LSEEDIEELRNLRGWRPTAQFIKKWKPPTPPP
jgi:hypothetical protein